MKSMKWLALLWGVAFTAWLAWVCIDGAAGVFALPLGVAAIPVVLVWVQRCDSTGGQDDLV